MSEKVELVIKIPKYYLTHPQDYSCLAECVRRGVPLPKGHGRLIDADSIYEIVRPIEPSDTEWGMTAETAIRLIHDAFNKAPTIIESDKESEG